MKTAIEYVVYMTWASGRKKYDPAEFSLFSDFDKKDARRMTEAEALKRVLALTANFPGRRNTTFGYEPADDATLVAERVEPVTYSNSYPPDSPHAAAHVTTEPTRDELVALLREALPLVNGSFEKPIAGQALAKRISAAINTPIPDVGENIGVYIDNN